MLNPASRRFLHLPGTHLSVTVICGMLVAAAVIAIAAGQPRFAQLLSGEDQIVLHDARGELLGQVVALGGGNEVKFRPEPGDLIPEPDIIGDYTAQKQFFERQDQLAAWARQPGAGTIAITRDNGIRREVVLKPTGRLPFEFWFQLGVGFAVFVISAWIWSIQSRALPNRLFGLAGTGLAIAAASAALYSTRWLALPSSLFVPFSNINGVGASVYGAAMICLFLVYPVRLASGRVLLAVALFVGGWVTLGIFDQLGAPPNETPLLTATEMALILILVIVQFFCSRRNPLHRAAIRWVGLSTLVGSGLFITTAVLPVLFGSGPLIDQSYAFAFFLVVHLGVALGLRRNALFASEQWSITMLRAVTFGLLLIVVDVILITLLGSIGGATVLTLLLLLPFFYLPWRSFVQRWLVGSTPVENLLEATAHIALVDDPDERARQWEDILVRAFSPLDIAHASTGTERSTIVDDGIGLQIPAIMGSPALLVRYKARGTRLFQTRDRQLSDRLVDLAWSLKRQHDAYKQGVTSERSRISRDLHDDLAARLISGLDIDDPSQLKGVLRASLAEVRSIVAAEESGPGPLIDVLADSRAEAAERLEAAGIELRWPLIEAPGVLEPLQRKALVSVLREVVTNTIRHSAADCLSVQARVDNERLYVVAADNGASFDGTIRQGNGLKNMSARIAAVQGYFDYAGSIGAGFRVSFNLPVAS